ncbi:MAG: CPBP family intramembrane metalloprotease [Leptolyngbyaceae cyanobacterium HOT.MB2.61]|jgi:membrane protease YdiL (CAAX protease family)|nr:CPBP family intramembrane metalloprotease [Leptolyngbyaceae cyanobacterium HOT.MB2.61]
MVIFRLLNLFESILEGRSAIALTVVFFLVWIVLWLPIAIPLAIVCQWRPPAPLTVQQKLPLVLSLYALAPPILWSIAWLEKIPFSTYGLGWNLSVLQSLAIGLIVGILGVVLLFALEGWLGWIVWQSPAWKPLGSVLPLTFLIGLLVSVVEELVFRGFLLNQLQLIFAPWLAAIGSSLIFSLLHLVWEGKETIPQLPGLGLMGFVLVLARWVDGGSLGLAIGLHAGWIGIMAGLDSARSIHYCEGNPEWITGLSGKPLAGVMGLLLLLLTATVAWGLGNVNGSLAIG